jgi:hypothetical protein
MIDVAYWHFSDLMARTGDVRSLGASGLLMRAKRTLRGHQYAKEANVKLVISNLLRESPCRSRRLILMSPIPRPPIPY